MIGSILIGLMAGWLAGKLVRGDGYGVLGDILLGLVGGVIGGWLFGAFGVHAHHMLSSLVVSTIGAAVLVTSTHIIRGEI
jgi:uncharacterized membrane protein YeaQ/YmgE (transglycosylase-associated protein family)